MKRGLISMVMAVTMGCTGVAALAADSSAAASKQADSVPTDAAAKAKKKAPAPLVACELGAARQQCCSATKCKGKVLNNKDRHNCKNSGGKSWHAANSTTCTRL